MTGLKQACAAVMLLFAAALIVPLQPTSEISTPTATHGCYGAECTGLDPKGRCDGDAEIVASMAVEDWFASPGQLDLRYSESCKANWGRFTPYSRYFNAAALGSSVPLWGRVTVWNPGEPSQPTVQSKGTAPLFGSDWSRMVDGTKTACTGVEVFWISDYKDSLSPTIESSGWHWGPCV
jgi:hypothetical protein